VNYVRQNNQSCSVAITGCLLCGLCWGCFSEYVGAVITDYSTCSLGYWVDTNNQERVIMDWFSKIDKYISLILVSLLILLGGSYFWNSRLNQQLKEAEAETQSALDDLRTVKGVSSFYKSELDRVTAEMDRRIREADERIASLTDQVTVRKTLIDQLRAENERLKADLIDTISLPVEDPLPPDELIQQASELYFPRTFEDSASVLFPADMVQVMLREIQQRRELDFNNSKVITEQDKQIADLGKIISDQESRYFGLQSKFDTQTGLVTSLENEIVQYDSVVAGLNKQVGLYKKKFHTGWLYKVAAPLALVGGVYLGSKL